METQTKQSNGKMPAYTIFLPVEQTEGEKRPWKRVGVIFVNRDNSLNLLINERDGTTTKLQARAFHQGGKA